MSTTHHLTSFGLLEISGPDSERFLQGQLTCDVTSLAAGCWTLGACCTAKGRMVANFVIGRQADRFLLRLPRSQVGALKQHLSRYAVFFKTSLTESNWSVLGHLPSSLSPTLLIEPRPLNSTEQGFQCQWPDGRVEEWGDIRTDGLNTDETAWLMADIQQGLVWVDETTREQWVPQHIDWHIQGGISFKKGCYTGQEIVARLQYLGKSKRHLMRLNAETALELASLAPLVDEHGKTLGEIAYWHNQQGLGIVTEERSQCLDASGNTLNLTPMFYATAVNE